MRLSRHAGTRNRTLRPRVHHGRDDGRRRHHGHDGRARDPARRHHQDTRPTRSRQIVRTQLQNASAQAITRQHDMIVSASTRSASRCRTFWDANNNGTIDAGEKRVVPRSRHGHSVRRPGGERRVRRGDHAPISGAAIATVNGTAVADLPPRRLGELGRGDLRLDRGARSEDVPRARVDAVDRPRRLVSPQRDDQQMDDRRPMNTHRYLALGSFTARGAACRSSRSSSRWPFSAAC